MNKLKEESVSKKSQKERRKIYMDKVRAEAEKKRREEEDAKNNEVIRHNNKMKPYQGEGELSKWYYYANLTGFIKDICAKYPKGCN